MARRIDELYYDITARTKGFTRGIASAQGGLRGFVGKLGGVTTALAAFGAAAVAAGIKATRMAAQLDSALREVSTLLPGTVENVGRLREEIIQLSTEVPAPPEMLTRGLYQVISAGITDTAEAMEVLGVSARAAVAGLTDTFTSVDAITTVLNAYQLETSEAARVSDVFFNTIKEGKLQFGDIAANIGTVATSAALAGVSIEEVGAALATLTKFGVNSAEAATSLNRLLLSLTQVTGDQAAAAKRMGIEFNLAAVQSKGLVGFLQDLQQATGGNIDLLAELNPNIRSARAAFVLAGEGADEYGRILAEMSDSGGSAGEAFNKMNGSLENQSKILKNQLNAAWLNLGASILPLVLAALEGVNRLLESDTETTIRLLRALGRESAAATLQAQEADRKLTESIEKNSARIERSLITRRRALLEFRQGIAGGPQSGQLEGQFAALEGIVDKFRLLPDLAGQTADEQEAILEGAIDYANELRETVRLTVQQQLALADVEAMNVRLLGLIQQQNLLQQEARGPSDREARIQSEIAALRERASILSGAGEAEAENVKRIRDSIALRENELATISATADLATAQSEAFARSADEAAEQARHARRAAAATTGAERERFLQQAKAFENTQRALQRVNDLERARLGIGKEINAGLAEQTGRIAELREALAQVNAELRDPAILEAFDLESQIDAAQGAIDRLREAFQFARDGFPGLVEDPGADFEAFNLGAAKRQIEEVLRSTDQFGIKALAVQGILDQWGISVSDLPPEIQKAVAAYIETNRELDETDRKMLALIQDVSFAARGATELANAFGLVGDEAAASVNQISLIAEGIGRIASGDILAGVGGALSGIAGLVGGLFGGGGPSEEELARRQSLEDNSRRIRELTDRLDILANVMRGLPGGLVESITAALVGPLAELDAARGGAGGFISDPIREATAAIAIADALASAGVSITDIERAAAALNLDVDQLVRLLSGDDLEFAELREAVQQAESLFAVLERGLDDVLATVQGRLDLIRISFDVLDIEDPAEQLRLLAEELGKAGTALSAAEIQRIGEGDEELIEDLFRQLVSGTGRFTQIGAFGELSFDEFLDILREMERIQDRIADGVEVGAEGDFQNVSAVNRATVEQAERMVALLGTSNFYLERILGAVESPLQVTDAMLAAAGTVRVEGRFTHDVRLSGDSLEGVSQEGLAAIGSAIGDSLNADLDLGESLRRERAGLGLPPVRTQ